MKKLKKIKLKLKENRLVVIYTKNLYTQQDYDELINFIRSINWEKKGCVIIPSEYVKKIKIIKRKRK